MERRRTFSREFKLEAVKLVTERGVAVAQAAKDLDVHDNVLRKWVRELGDEPLEAFPGNGKQKAQDAEIARLREEVAKLKLEGVATYMDVKPIAETLSNGLSAMIIASGQEGDFTVVYTLMPGEERLPGHRHQ